MATVLLVIVLALVGVTSFALLGGFTKTPTTFTCQPVNSPACGKYENLQNSSVPFTASLPSGESTSGSGYTFNFGDGHSNGTNATIIHHAYQTPGTYIVSASATVAGQQHDDYNDLIVVTVTPSFTAATAGTTPTVQSAILGNSSLAASTASAVLNPGQF
ncbi:MAG: PKD domain-containing protein, partial [Thermoplasmata archaeon]|nr:PKD domain-containing protein [Thermoplasmata archaeon]